MKMTREEACEFFHRYGNVGRDVQDVMKATPTKRQLIAASNSAARKGQWDKVIQCARETLDPDIGPEVLADYMSGR